MESQRNKCLFCSSNGLLKHIHKAPNYREFVVFLSDSEYLKGFWKEYTLCLYTITAKSLGWKKWRFQGDRWKCEIVITAANSKWRIFYQFSFLYEIVWKVARKPKHIRVIGHGFHWLFIDGESQKTCLNRTHYCQQCSRFHIDAGRLAVLCLFLRTSLRSPGQP